MPRWLLHTLLTMLLWGAWGVVSKPLSSAMSPWQMQTLSSLGLIPVVLALAGSRQARAGTRRGRGFAQAFAAGLIVSLGNVACFQAMALGGKAAAVIPLTSVYPLVTVLLACLWLRERLNGIQIGGIGASLVALYCFNAGGETAFLTPWLAMALVPILLWGISALLQKLATAHASNELATLGFLAGFAPVAVLTPLFQPLDWQMPGSTWLLLLLCGVLFGLGNLTLIFAYGGGGKAAIVTPMASLYSVVTIPFAVLLLHERIGSREGAGIAAALVAVTALSCERPASTPAPGAPVAASTAESPASRSLDA